MKKYRVYKTTLPGMSTMFVLGRPDGDERSYRILEELAKAIQGLAKERPNLYVEIRVDFKVDSCICWPSGASTMERIEPLSSSEQDVVWNFLNISK